ncbi:GNAT family N-acetyltransferase [Streptococcus suis]|nr:GNAT family N-acetyltransferase [Streptococcus suis]
MLKLEAVSGENIWDILKLDVFEEQQEFVASNSISLSEAYLVLKEQTEAQVFPFGIYDSNTLIGFMMIGYGKCWQDAPDIADQNYTLWRLMIDKSYQQKGYGRQAVELAIQFVKQLPCGPANYFWLSYETENQAAQSLYSSCGFYETGELDHDELIAVLDLEN